MARDRCRHAGDSRARRSVVNLDAFLLTKNWREQRGGLEFELWAASDEGPVRILIPGQEAVFFVHRDSPAQADRRAGVNLRTLDGTPVDALYFQRRAALRNGADSLRNSGAWTGESDVRPIDRYLMERFITAGLSIEGEATHRDGYLEFISPALRASDYVPKLQVLSIDIETEGMDGALYSIAVSGENIERVFIVGAGEDTETVQCLPDEAALLLAFIDTIATLDPDVLIGWNVVGFDLFFLQQRAAELGVPFSLGRAKARARISPREGPGQFDIADVPGRVVLDGIASLRTATHSFESYSLEFVANAVLQRGKLIEETDEDKVAEITRLYHEDPHALAAYNLEDCRLVLDIFKATGLLRFLEERAQLTGLAMDRQGGSVAAFDYLYLPRLHRAGYVGGDLPTNPPSNPSPGGYVMDSEPGLHDNVLVLDFKSLYPSIIRTFHVDPLALAEPGDDGIPGFYDGAFSRTRHILPELIETLWAARDEAKRQKNKAHSQAIKIIMNSFYGVLGTPGCRFFDPRLSGSITRRGHEIITRSRDVIQAEGFKVIYGDTDSLFVLVGPAHTEDTATAEGDRLASLLNAWWRKTLEDEYQLESKLEIEFETLYLRFLMPRMRSSDKGTKKRYAGLLRAGDGGAEVVFKGMEFVRSDATPLTRTFQMELYRRVFLGEPYADYVHQIARELLAGKHDDALMYRKRLRKPPDEYVKNVPPHVQAARKLANPGSRIEYFITVHGPEPRQHRASPLDYAHYLDRQLAPAADSILDFLGTSFAALTDPQQDLFREEV